MSRAVVNVHHTTLPATLEEAGFLIDRLASAEDVLWPADRWPPLRLDNGLEVGSAGGHGPVRYTVVDYRPGARVEFRFRAPRGFDGFHRLELEEDPGGEVVLIHRLEMRARGPALLSWPLVFRPLHDALIDDALANAESALGHFGPKRRWSLYVRLLRRLFALFPSRT